MSKDQLGQQYRPQVPEGAAVQAGMAAHRGPGDRLVVVNQAEAEIRAAARSVAAPRSPAAVTAPASSTAIGCPKRSLA